MSRRRWSGRTAAIAVSAVLLSSCSFSLQSLPKLGAMSGPSYKVIANFSNVVNLPADAQVRIGSFQVGQVTNIGLTEQAGSNCTTNDELDQTIPNCFEAVVTMKIKQSVKLPTGTTASIAFDTPLGEDYVVLTEPAAAATATTTSYVAPGSSLSQVGTPAPSVEDTFAALGALLNGGGLDQLQTIISQTNLALDGNQPQIRALINNLNATVTSLAGNEPAIDSALSAMATLSQTLNQGSTAIATGLQALGPAAQELSSQSQDIDQLFVNLDALSNSANSIINASLDGSIATFQQLTPLLDQLTEVQGQLDPALTAIKSLEAYTPRAVPGQYLQLSINATVDIPPVPSDALPLDKVTVDPPDSQQSYRQDPDEAAIALVIAWGLP